MSARERFLKKVQPGKASATCGKTSVDVDIQAFRWRMDDLAQQVSEWFAGTCITVTLGIRHIHDLSTIGYSLENGICRYDITTIRLQNGEHSVRIMPEQLCRGREIGCVVMRVETADIQVFQLSLAPEKGWFIRREHQSAQDNVMMTEELFFRAIERLA